jgi:hypothetical protein
VEARCFVIMTTISLGIMRVRWKEFLKFRIPTLCSSVGL